MKWTLTNSTDEKFSSTESNSIRQRNSSLFISALLRYTMRRRKQSEDESNQTVRLAALTERRRNGFGGIDSHQAKRALSPLSKEKLLAIQIKLALLSDEDGDRPIHIAVVNGDLKLVQKLCLLMLKNKISLDITNYLRQTPLHLAVIVGNIEIIQLLLNFGASPTICNKNGNTILHLCVKSHNDEAVLNHLLKHNKVKDILNSIDYEGYCALHYAVFKNNTNAVKILKDSGADMNKIDGKSGRTALIHAIVEQNVNMVELLLDSGARPQNADYSGRSAFEMAIQIANVAVIRLLDQWMAHNEVITIEEKRQTIHHKAKIKRTKN